jgi:hypothetical protein
MDVDVNSDAGFEQFLASQAQNARETDSDVSEIVPADRTSAADIQAAVTASDSGLSVADGLTLDGDAAPQKSGRELADDAIARTEELRRTDPGWTAYENRKREAAEAASEDFGSTVELAARNVSDALYEADGDVLSPHVIAHAVALARRSPMAVERLADQLNERVYSEADEMGLDVDDDDYPQEGAMAGDLLRQAVNSTLARERTQAEYESLHDELAQKEKDIRDIASANYDESARRLIQWGADKGLIPSATEARLRQLDAVRAEAAGDAMPDLESLAVESPDELMRAVKALDDHLRSAGENLFHRDLLATPTGSVTEGFTQTRDEDVEQFRAAFRSMGKRRSLRTSQSAASIKRSIAAPDPSDWTKALTTRDGKPISVDDLTGERERREAEKRLQQARVYSGLRV